MTQCIMYNLKYMIIKYIVINNYIVNILSMYYYDNLLDLMLRWSNQVLVTWRGDTIKMIVHRIYIKRNAYTLYGAHTKARSIYSHWHKVLHGLYLNLFLLWLYIWPQAQYPHFYVMFFFLKEKNFKIHLIIFW
jgi:hypothetical protein